MKSTPYPKASPNDPTEPNGPAARSRRPNAQLAYWAPWSELATVWLAGGRRLQMAIWTASTTGSDRM